MQISRQQMLNGVARYMRSEVVPHIPDKGIKVMLEAMSSFVEMSPQVIGKYLDAPLVAAMLQEKEGYYDLDLVEAALVKAMEAHGGLEITIPSIPLISPQAKSMTFSANDLRTLKRYMEA